MAALVYTSVSLEGTGTLLARSSSPVLFLDMTCRPCAMAPFLQCDDRDKDGEPEQLGPSDHASAGMTWETRGDGEDGDSAVRLERWFGSWALVR